MSRAHVGTVKGHPETRGHPASDLVPAGNNPPPPPLQVFTPRITEQPCRLQTGHISLDVDRPQTPFAPIGGTASRRAGRQQQPHQCARLACPHISVYFRSQSLVASWLGGPLGSWPLQVSGQATQTTGETDGTVIRQANYPWEKHGDWPAWPWVFIKMEENTSRA